MDKVLFSHKTDEWFTPLSEFKKYFPSDAPVLDPCAGPSHLCSVNWGVGHDGLHEPWLFPSVFVNPPYSCIGKWVEKAFNELLLGHCKSVYFLVPSRTDTKWFQFLWHLQENGLFIVHFRFLDHRVHFSGSKSSAPFPCVWIEVVRVCPYG